MMNKQQPYLVGIDIGSSKVGVLIGQRSEEDRIEVVGKGLASNRGTRKGNVVNVESTVTALKQACEEAEVMAGVEIAGAYVGVAGADVKSVNVRGMVSVGRKDREISRQDIGRVLDAAQAAALPSDREIIHAIPQEFIVDGQGGISDPLGMLGSRLEVSVHLVTGNITRNRTLLTCINRAGIEVIELLFEPLVTAEAVLSEDEKEHGVLLLDLGSGTTEYCVISEGEVQHSAVLGIGAGHFTNDLSMVLRTPFAEAERIKVKHGCCLQSLVGEEEGVSVPTVAGGATKIVPKREICAILQPRAEELFGLIRDDLRRQGLAEPLRGGVVLTGGGAQLDGLLEIVGQIFNASVRYGLPQRLGGLVDVISSPTWCTATGLLRWGHESEKRRARTGRKNFLSVKGMMGSLRSMFEDLL